MAHGMRQGIFETFLASVPKMKGKLVAKAVADCIAGKLNSAMLLLITINSIIGCSKKAGKLPIIEAKGPSDLIDRCSFAHFPDVGIECRSKSTIHEIRISEYESFFHIEPDGYNVHGILHCEFVDVL